MLHFLDNVYFEVCSGARFLHDTLKVREGKHVAIFMVAVVRTVLLDCIIGQVDVVVVEVLCIHVVRCGACAQIALLEEVDIHFVSEADPHPNIKLSLIHEQRPLYILLNDKGLRTDGRLMVPVGGSQSIRFT